MGIAIGAFFRIRVSQEEKATETVMFKIQNQFDAQWRAVLDNAKEDAKTGWTDPISVPGYGFAKGLSGGDNRRALVILTKVLLKREFPTTFYESLVWSQTMYQNFGVPQKSSYVRGLAGITPLDPTTMTSDQIMTESAVLLYMTMTQARRGVTGFNPSDVGPHAVGSVTLTWYPSQPSYPVFVDTWGQPI